MTASPMTADTKTPKKTRTRKSPKASVAPSMKLALVFDTETTGLIKNRTIALDKQPEVIEFYGALVDLKTGEILKEYETLIKPKIEKLPDIITKITGLFDADLAAQQPFAHHAPAILNFIEEAPVVIAHNLSFDRDMLEIEFERLGQKVNWPTTLCTVEQTLHMRGYRLNQAALYESLFNEKFAGAHRARNDVKALIRICVELHRQEMI